jgi:hypothetical protein
VHAAPGAAAWATCLSRAESNLAGGLLSEEAFTKPPPELHEHYAHRFGLDSELGRRTFVEHCPAVPAPGSRSG